jgi:hypothetical protein
MVLAQTWTKTFRDNQSTRAMSAATFPDNTTAFSKLWHGSAQLAKTESFTSVRGFRNAGQRDMNRPVDGWPRRDVSWRVLGRFGGKQEFINYDG